MSKEGFNLVFLNLILFVFSKALPVCLVDIKPCGAESEWQKQVRSKTFNLDIDISFRVSDWGFGWRSDKSTRGPIRNAI